MSALFRRRSANASTAIPEVTAADAADLLMHDALLIDVREPVEWNTGHAPSARHIPLSQLTRYLCDLPKDRRIILVCRSGNRSAQATAILTAAGLDASNLTGGMSAWARSGLPVVSNNGAPGTVS
jgi:rhodanese-related sulfurtransferase